MSQPLFDRTVLPQRRRRVRPGAAFLHEAARDDLQLRLTEINRTFHKVAIVSGMPETWVNAWPEADIVADSETLNFSNPPYDLILHGNCLHHMNDPVGQLIQCQRALCPDGLFLGVLFAGETLRELRQALLMAEAETRGGAAPRISPMADLRSLGALLQRAGFAMPVADSWQVTVEYPNALRLMHDLRYMGEGNILAARDKKPLSRDLISALERIYKERFSGPQGRLLARFELAVLTGWAPDPSQPKPLRPGSVTTHLADALKAAKPQMETPE
jgi:SAM-dependent methyltransferase